MMTMFEMQCLGVCVRTRSSQRRSHPMSRKWVVRKLIFIDFEPSSFHNGSRFVYSLECPSQGTSMHALNSGRPRLHFVPRGPPMCSDSLSRGKDAVKFLRSEERRVGE